MQYIDTLKNNKNSAFFFVEDYNGNYNYKTEYFYAVANFYYSKGLNVYMVHEKVDYKIPYQNYDKLVHISFEEISENKEIKITPVDYIFVPEIYIEVVAQMRKQKVPAEIIVVSQDYNKIFDPLEIGENWLMHGIKHVITVSEEQRKYLLDFFPSLDVRVLNPFVADDFIPATEPRKPIVTFISGNERIVENTVKKFQTKYTQYAWIPFKIISPLSTADMARQLKESACAVDLEEYSPFKLEALQAFKTKTPVIGLLPKLSLQWLNKEGKVKNNAVWTINEMQIIDFLALFIDKWVTDQLDDSVIETAYEDALPYSEEIFKNNLEDIFLDIKNKRISFLEGLAQPKQDINTNDDAQ